MLLVGLMCPRRVGAAPPIRACCDHRVPAPEEMSRDELIALVGEQAQRMATQAARIAAQDAQITALATRAAELMQANEDLADRLARLEHLLSRDSRNSSSPPSKDDEPGKPTLPPRSKRGAGGPKRRPGKQSGAPGFHLAWTDTPDERSDRFPHGPCVCGQDLAAATDLGVADRYQQHDIPQVAVTITQRVTVPGRAFCFILRAVVGVAAGSWLTDSTERVPDIMSLIGVLRRVAHLSLVVESGLQDDQVVVIDQVDQPVLFGDSTRPGVGEHVLERFGFADAFCRIAQCIVDESVDPFEDLPVGLEPMLIVVPAVRCEHEPHSASSCSRRSPDLACCRLSRSRLALAGTRNRYAVSSSAANSSADISTALPRREVISTATRSLLTFSINGKSSAAAPGSSAGLSATLSAAGSPTRRLASHSTIDSPSVFCSTGGANRPDRNPTNVTGCGCSSSNRIRASRWPKATGSTPPKICIVSPAGTTRAQYSSPGFTWRLPVLCCTS